MWQDITEKDREKYNAVVHHPLQSYEWGEFREATGVKVVRRGLYVEERKEQGSKLAKGELVKGFQMTVHKIPYTNFTIGYFPKSDIITQEILDELIRVAKENRCIYIQLEPNVLKIEHFNLIENWKLKIEHYTVTPSFHPLFTQYTFILDLTKSEEELLKQMHPKTRYNIRVAQKHGVEIIEDNTKEAFEQYWRIMEETTHRQRFYAHTKKYHELQRQIFGSKNKDLKFMNEKTHKSSLINHNSNHLQYHLFLAKYIPTNNHTLAAWVLFTYHDTLYYPYGASTSEHRETMASNLMMWEAIKFGKTHGLKKFDMWGSLGQTPDTKDPWYGFHKFKQGYGPTLTEFVGSYDLVINPLLYRVLKIGDKLRWFYLKMKK